MKRILCCFLLLILIVVAGCNSKETVTKMEINQNNLIDFNDYNNSEEIPDWEGEKINLSVWVDASAPNAYQSKKLQSDEDVVTPEFERVTGVHFDPDNSFDNAGNSFDSKIAQIIATEDFPSAATRIPNVNDLVKIDALYDLSEYIKTYAPTVYKLYGPDSKSAGFEWKRQIDNYGGVYSLTLGSDVTLRDSVKLDGFYDISDEQLSWKLGYGRSEHPYIYVRDDILKQIFPEAHTAAELKDIFDKNGTFTEEEIFDVPIESPEQLIDFLYEVRNTLEKNNEEDTYAFYTHCGSDNWPILTNFGGLLQYGGTVNSANYFSYYDLEDDEIKFTFKELWFKDVLALHNKLIRDGVASEEALIDTNAIFKEKVAQGKYAVLINDDHVPANNNIGDDFIYRKVFMKYKIRDDKFLNTESIGLENNGWSFFKKGISEDHLIQAIRAMEFAVSAPGQKLMFWGPKSAGFYEENEDGNLIFKDEQVRDYLVFDKRTENDPAYGFTTGPWPGRFCSYARPYDAKIYYNPNTNWEREFDAAKYYPMQLVKSNHPNIYAAAVTAEIPEADRFWKSRQVFEDALLKCFSSTNDAQFEENYNDMIALAEKNGLTEETRKKFDEFFKNDYNKNYMDNIYAK